MRFIPALVVSMAMLVAVSCADAAIFIQQGKDYTFGGYLVIGRGPCPAGTEHPQTTECIRVRLSTHANGEIPAGLIGRQDLLLNQGSLVKNLFTVAREFGPTTQVIVAGKGNKEGGLDVQIIEKDQPLTLNGGFNPAMATAAVSSPMSPELRARTDALVRFAKIHPQVGHPMADGYAAKVKSTTTNAQNQIVVVVDNFGGFAGTWLRQAVQFTYAADGSFVSQQAAVL